MGDWADTSGDHLAAAAGAGSSEDAEFSRWWEDPDAQAVINIMVDGSYDTDCEPELAAIRKGYFDALWGDEYYIDDLNDQTPNADCVCDDPERFLKGDEA